jgi:hypothetical protein
MDAAIKRSEALRNALKAQGAVCLEATKDYAEGRLFEVWMLLPVNHTVVLRATPRHAHVYGALWQRTEGDLIEELKRLATVDAFAALGHLTAYIPKPILGPLDAQKIAAAIAERVRDVDVDALAQEFDQSMTVARASLEAEAYADITGKPVDYHSDWREELGLTE